MTNEAIINSAVSENADANRLKRITEAQTYHSPVEEKIRSYDERVQKVNMPPAPPVEPVHSGLFITVRPSDAKPKIPTTPPIKGAMTEGAPREGDPNGSATDQPKAPARRSIAKNGTEYVIEERDTGPVVIASAKDRQPIRMYDDPIPVEEDMLTPDDERNFLEKAAATSSDMGKGAVRGLGMGLTNLTLNTMRTAVDNPIGEQIIGTDRVQSFEDFTNKYIDDMNTWAEGETKTTAGGVAQAGGEIVGNFVAPAVKLYQGFRAMKASPLVASFLADATVAVFGVRPEDPNLSDLIPEDSQAFGALRDLLGTDPADPEWVNRGRNAVEAMALLGVGEASGRGLIKGIEEVKRLSKESDVGPKLSGLIDKVMQRKGKAAMVAAPAAAAAAALTPDQAEANARTDVLTKAIKLLNDAEAPVGRSVINDEMVTRIRNAAEGTNPVEGLDFNLARIENGEDLGGVIDEISRIYSKQIGKAKRGVQTFDETQLKADMSREMGFDVDAVLSRQTGEVWPAHKIKAARDLFVAEINKTKTMALAIKQPGGNSEDALVAFRRQLAVNAALQAQIKGAQTEVARSLAQFRMTAKSPLESRVQMREIIDSAGGHEVNEQLVDAFINAVDNGGPDAAAIFSREAQNVTTMDMLFEAWINSLLGSPVTHMVNMMGNSIAASQGIIERYAAAGYGSIERGVAQVRGIPIEQGITFGEAHAYAGGMAGSVMDTLRMFHRAGKNIGDAAYTGSPIKPLTEAEIKKGGAGGAAIQAMKTGRQADTYGKLDYNRESITAQNVNQLPISKSIAGRLGKDELLDANSKLAMTVDFLGEYYYRLPGRFLMAEDDLFKTLNYRAELHARAVREVSAMQNATFEEKQARMLEILRDPQVAAPDIHLGSIDQMREQTFTSAPGDIAKPFLQGLNAAKIGDFPVGRVVVPFFNVINNIMKYVGSRTPGLALINPKSKTFQDLFSGDPARRQLVMGKWAVGGSIMGTAAWLNLNGVCTGRLTDNPELRRQMETQGKKPFACVVPMPDGSFRTMQYNRLDPVGMTMGIAATTAEVLHYVEDEETREMLGIAATSAIMPYLEEKSYFQGISEFMDALNPQYGNDDSRVQAMSKYFQGVIASAPGAVAGPLAPNTPAARVVTRMTDGMTRRDSATDKYRIEKDAWGDDILVPNGTAYRTWEGIVRKVMSGTPGLSDNLPPQTNIWGEPLVMEFGLSPDSRMAPIASSTITYDVKKLRAANVPDAAKAGYFFGLRVGQDMTLKQFDEFVNIVGINGELERLGAPLRKPRRELAARNGNKVVGMPVELNPRQYYDFIKTMNTISVPNDSDPQRRSMNLKQALDWLVRQPEYAKLPDDGNANGAKGDFIRRMSDKYRDAATNIFFSDDKDGPALMRRSIELKLKAQNTGVQ